MGTTELAKRVRNRTRNRDAVVNNKQVATKKTVGVEHTVEARHCQRNAGNRNAFPKRVKKQTRPFETTMDF